MSCTCCRTLACNPGSPRAHENLKQVGLTQRVARPGRVKAAWVIHHLCTTCKTLWRHVDDPLNPSAGWTREGPAASAAQPDLIENPMAMECGA
jgi:hypothetical protein